MGKVRGSRNSSIRKSSIRESVRGQQAGSCHIHHSNMRKYQFEKLEIIINSMKYSEATIGNRCNQSACCILPSGHNDQK